MSGIKIDYVEFASGDIAASKAFYGRAFGWTFVDYGPEYQAFADAGLDGGIDGSGQIAAGTSLVILKADDLEAALREVQSAGGTITAPIFAFPGGRRFHFREPGGAEIGVWSEG